MSSSPFPPDWLAAGEALSAFLDGKRHDIEKLSEDLGLTLLELGRGVVSYALSPVFKGDLNLLLGHYGLDRDDFCAATLLASADWEDNPDFEEELVEIHEKWPEARPILAKAARQLATAPRTQSLIAQLDPELGRLDAAAKKAVVGLLGLLPDGFENYVLQEVHKKKLLRTLRGAREGAAPIGPRPNFGDKEGSQASPAPAPVIPLVGSSTPQRQSSITPLTESDRRSLLTLEGRKACAARLADQYTRERDAALEQLVRGYMYIYLDRCFYNIAINLFNFFEECLRERRVEVEDPFHRDIFELLRAGLPIQRTHLKGLPKVSAEALLSNPAYPGLLLGIRKTETSYPEAIEHLERSGPTDCVLRAYALGECYRKVDRLDLALAQLKWAEAQASCWGRSDHCPCGPMCPKEGLLLAIHRGIGAVYRNKRQWEEARREFQSAERFATQRVPEWIRSDFFFSYGYFVFEKACRSFDFRDPSARQQPGFREQLNEARRLFHTSENLSPEWSAPLARRAIIQQLLGEPSVETYLQAKVSAENESKNIEADLTAVNCGFGVLLEELNFPSFSEYDLKLTSSGLFREFAKILLEQNVPKGPLNGHAFDNSVIRAGRPIEGDPYLLAVDELFQESTQWQLGPQEERKQRLEAFRRRQLL